METKLTIGTYLYIGAWVGCVLFFWAALNVPPAEVPLFALPGILFLAIAIYLTLLKIAKKNKEAQLEIVRKSVSEYVSLNEATSELTVTKRHPDLRKVLTLVEYTEDITRYKPEQVHFGSVTVGGVTTGGTYKTGGYSYVAGQLSTGRYILAYDNKKMIKTIKLSPELYKEASASPIKPYLNNDQGIQVVTEPASDVFFAIERRPIERLPDYKKGNEIINWLACV